MKRFLFLVIMTIAVFNLRAQDLSSQVNQLSKLVEIGSASSEKRDSVLIEIKNIRDTTTSIELKRVADNAYHSIKELSVLEKNKVYSKSLSDLKKEDLKNFRVNDDKFREITFIHHKKGYNFSPYLSIKKGVLNMRLKAHYIGTSWVFFDNVIILSGGKRYNFSFPNTSRDVGSGSVYEEGDIWVSPEMLNELREISQNNEVEIRYSGKYNYDKALSKQEVIALREVIELYDKLKK